MNFDYNKIVKYFIENNISVTFMESCTSGLLASVFTDTEGASKVFYGSFVTYSNEAKIKAGVDKNIIEKYGVYSPECARSMALTAQNAFKTDVSVGITGTTGNTDPNNDGNIGEVFFCIAVRKDYYEYNIKPCVTDLSRNEIKQLYVSYVYKELEKIFKV